MSLKNIISLLSFTLCTTLVPFTLMIDPAGDSMHTGREINDSFERGLTLQCAQELQQQISIVLPQLKTIITRSPGETVQSMHNARFANRMPINLYLRIGFYHEPEMPNHCSIFYYCNNQTDFWYKNTSLQFYPIDQAHVTHLKLTKQLGLTFLQILQNNTINPAFAPHGLFTIPIKPLIGIQAPALYLEAGLGNSTDWQYLIKPLISCIKAITP
jgi:hypothetical protein